MLLREAAEAIPVIERQIEQTENLIGILLGTEPRTGTVGVGGNVFNGMAFGPFGFFGIAPSASLPLFTAGRLQAGVDSAEARTQEAGFRYQQTIQQAFRKVGDALVAYAKNREFRVEKDANNPTTNRGLPDVREGDFDVTWNIAWVKGLQFRFRNAYVAQGGTRVLQAFRIILNYEFPLL